MERIFKHAIDIKSAILSALKEIRYQPLQRLERITHTHEKKENHQCMLSFIEWNPYHLFAELLTFIMNDSVE